MRRHNIYLTFSSILFQEKFGDITSYRGDEIEFLGIRGDGIDFLGMRISRVSVTGDVSVKQQSEEMDIP